MAGINAGLPSDRIMLDWHLEARASPPRRRSGDRPDMPAPTRCPHRADPNRDIDALMRDDPAAALWVRMGLRALTESFAQGLRITGFDTGAAAYHLR